MTHCFSDHFKELLIDVAYCRPGSPSVFGRKPSLIESAGRAVAAHPVPVQVRYSLRDCALCHPSLGVRQHDSSWLAPGDRSPAFDHPRALSPIGARPSGKGVVVGDPLIKVSDHVAIFHSGSVALPC